MVSVRNTFSGRRVFARNSKQAGGVEITRKVWNICDRQQTGVTF
jgi:hypothetical protein